MKQILQFNMYANPDLKKACLEKHPEYKLLADNRKNLVSEMDPMLEKTKEKFRAFDSITKINHNDYNFLKTKLQNYIAKGQGN